MQRLFGKKTEKAPAPTLDGTVNRFARVLTTFTFLVVCMQHVPCRLTERGTGVDEKIKDLDKKLLEIKAQIAKARGYPP